LDVNPYQPPRAPDTDDGSAPPGGAVPVLPPEALGALVRSGWWARWIALLALISLVLAVFRNASRTALAESMILIVSAPVNVLTIVAFRRYAVETRKLARSEKGAVDGVLDRQRAVLKLHGLVLTVGAALWLVALLTVFVRAYAVGRWIGP
jgi:hypothetical protein